MYSRKLSKNYDLLNPFFSIQNDFGGIINSLYNDKKGGEINIQPKTDLRENKSHFIICMELAGVEQKDILISLEKNILTISGEKKRSEIESENKFYLQEIHSGKFQRTIEFNEKINDENIEANFKNGVLTVKIEKGSEKKEEIKKIEIK